jgi:hypothetical protein
MATLQMARGFDCNPGRGWPTVTNRGRVVAAWPSGSSCRTAICMHCVLGRAWPGQGGLWLPLPGAAMVARGDGRILQTVCGQVAWDSRDLRVPLASPSWSSAGEYHRKICCSDSHSCPTGPAHCAQWSGCNLLLASTILVHGPAAAHLCGLQGWVAHRWPCQTMHKRLPRLLPGGWGRAASARRLLRGFLDVVP